MKRIKILMLLIPVLCLSACNDFFDVSPKGSVALEDYQTKLNNLRISLNSVYSLMQTEDYQLSELIFGESISDNAYNMQDNESSDLSQLLNFQFNTENSYILKRYQVNFRGINLANQVISAVPNVVYNADYSNGAQQMRYILGQAKLLRALFYFNLVRSYGGVPIQPEKSELSQTVLARSSADDVYAYIEKDLREACLILYKDRYKDSDAGQAGIGAGLGLLMKVLAYQASPGTALEKPQRATKWKEAKEIGELFIDGKSMSYDKMLKFTDRYTGVESWEDLCKRLLLTDQAPTLETTISGDVANVHALIAFGDLFRLKSKFSKESLLEINHYDYSSSGSTIDERNLLYRCFNENTSYSVGPSPTQAIYDYRQTDPRGIFTAAAQTDIGSNFFKDENGKSVTLQWFNTAYGYVFTKYMVYPSEGTVYERSYMVMRYAEALLWYAEILNETGDQTRATEIVNKVRARAAKLLDPTNSYAQYNAQITSFKLYNVLPYEEVKKNIQNERRIELAGEFDRWFDLQRLGLLSEKMAYLASKNAEAADKNSGKPRWRGKYFKKGVNELMPIPQREITLSNGVITQNFGY